MTGASLRFDNVHLGYDAQCAVTGLSGRVSGGTRLAVAGANGSGKTTLMKAIAGLLKPVHGTIAIDGMGGRRIGYLPQASRLERDFPFTVRHLAATGLWERCGGWRRIDSTRQDEVQAALVTVGLRGFGNRPLAALSAGEFQRALFARLLLQDSPLLLLDEPFNAVDAATTEVLLEILDRWHDDGRTILCVLHDAAQIAGHFEHCLRLTPEGAQWSGPVLLPCIQSPSPHVHPHIAGVL